jgi:sigma-E factor negative regulatory protein RseA
MSDEQRQRISELQDGELTPSGASKLIDLLARDPNLRGDWERYHLIGLAIRNEPIVVEHRAIADAVRERIREEPTVLAPNRSGIDRRVKLKPAVGIALAAAAAFFAVFVAPALFDGSGGLQPGPGMAPTFVAQDPAAEIPARRWDLDRPELVNKLDLFLVTHQETAPTNGAKGMLPYATFVGYDAGR